MAARSGVESFDSNSYCSGAQMNRRDRRASKEHHFAKISKPARTLLALFALVSASACAGGGGGGSASPSQPTSPSAAEASLSGTWTGSAADSSGPGVLSWQVSQSGSSISGSVTMADTRTGIIGRGSLSGSLSGSSITFSISVPVGGFDNPFGSCSATISGTAQAGTGSITGTYTGSNSCSGDVGSGQFSMSRS